MHYSQPYLLVCLERHIHIFESPTMVEIRVLGTEKNAKGIMAASRPYLLTNTVSTNRTMIAYPESNSKGLVAVTDVLTGEIVSEIDAHRSAIAALTLNARGTIVATASGVGTVIRVFSVATGQRLFCFRRGVQEALIRFIDICIKDAYLAVGSSTGKIHIFSMFQSQSCAPSAKTTSVVNTETALVPDTSSSASAVEANLKSGHSLGHTTTPRQPPPTDDDMTVSSIPKKNVWQGMASQALASLNALNAFPVVESFKDWANNASSGGFSEFTARATDMLDEQLGMSRASFKALVPGDEKDFFAVLTYISPAHLSSVEAEEAAASTRQAASRSTRIEQEQYVSLSSVAMNASNSQTSAAKGEIERLKLVVVTRRGIFYR
jgi:hypothetical protein